MGKGISERDDSGKIAFSDYIVECSSVEGFLDRYYKQERYRGRGRPYAVALLESYLAEFERRGFVYISKHDSVTGKVVSYFRKD